MVARMVADALAGFEHRLRDMEISQKLPAVATGCATIWRIARHAPHTLRQACGRAPHATWWRPPPPSDVISGRIL
ncbi:hypothetical protein F511_47605 [Dorcoceras hygrometricum]|uniref:Uncharacterized protein n=1 Tax=Dorcoceras hygrometricum TaxID=472368 RepID=A0A2Z6ZXT6_9LAMI|nr:hypothetical protein F511_47605 [Dorcoceras hygrometricum]